MNCEQFQNLVHDLARNEPLDSNTIDAALSHAETCRACDALMDEAESLHHGLHSLAAQRASDQASARIEEALLEAFEQQFRPSSGLRGAMGRRVGARRGFWLASAAGVAAAAILFVSMAFHRGTPQPGSVTHAAQTQVETAADPAYEIGTDAPTEATVADSFVSLSPAFDSSSLDDDAVVRVVLSDAALESFGVPANEIGHGEVVADLVVASDGMPQAIRILGW
jgi:hypothetical protein